MVNVASGIVRVRIPSPTTAALVGVAASRKNGDLSHVGLVNLRFHISFHIAGQMNSLRMFIDDTRKMAPKENIQVNLCMQVTSLQFNMRDPFDSQLTAAKTKYPLTSLTWVTCSFFFFLFVLLTRLWIFIGSQDQVFWQFIRTSQNNRTSPFRLS